jgi:hypothetical protein
MKRILVNLSLLVVLPIVLWVGISLVVDYHNFTGACGIFGHYNLFYACDFKQYLLGGQTLPAFMWGSLIWATFAIPLAILQKPILRAFRSRRYARGLSYTFLILLFGAPFELFMPIQILIMYYRW